MNDPKPGWKTSEHLLTAALMAGAFNFLDDGGLESITSPAQAAVAVAAAVSVSLAVAAYAIARTLTKRSTKV